MPLTAPKTRYGGSLYARYGWPEHITAAFDKIRVQRLEREMRAAVAATKKTTDERKKA